MWILVGKPLVKPASLPDNPSAPCKDRPSAHPSALGHHDDSRVCGRLLLLMRGPHARGHSGFWVQERLSCCGNRKSKRRMLAGNANLLLVMRISLLASASALSGSFFLLQRYQRSLCKAFFFFSSGCAEGSPGWAGPLAVALGGRFGRRGHAGGALPSVGGAFAARKNVGKEGSP